MSRSSVNHVPAEHGWLRSAIGEFRRWQLWFPLCFVLIAAVSVYDMYLTVRFRDQMIYMEQNPFGRWLMVNCDGSVELFLELKLYGTLLVLLLLLLMHLRKSHITLPVTSSVASAQSVLLTYLTFA